MQVSSRRFTFTELFVTLVIILAFFAMMPKAYSQEVKLSVATGGTSGTYSKMFNELNEYCRETGLNLVEVNTSGSIENLEKMSGNQVNAAIVQTDVLWLANNTPGRDLSSIKTLFTLHPEEIHVIALSAGKTLVEKKWGGFKTEETQLPALNTVSELQGKKVGAWGGSYTSSMVIRLQGQIGFDVFDVGNQKNAMASLDSGEIDAIIAVGGAPLEWVSGLSNRYKLLDFSESIVKRLENVYRPASLHYAKIGASGVRTVAVDAIFVTRDYKTARYVGGLSKLRACLQSNLDVLKEETGKHPKWQTVSYDNKGKWPWYELPAATGIRVKPK